MSSHRAECFHAGSQRRLVGWRSGKPERHGRVMGEQVPTHAVVVRVTMNAPAEVLAALPGKVMPMASSAPGFIHGYMTVKDTGGLAMFLFESEEKANASCEHIE